jgi:septal ring factor EnvC (AmiA/AmiB activator)
MPEVSLSVIVTIIAMIFTAGITWGVASTRQNKHGTQISDLVRELKLVVQELKTLTMELHVMKASSARVERDIENHEKRIAFLELELARLQAKLTNK